MQTIMKEKKMCACPNIENSWQKCFIKNHNLSKKNTILHYFNILILLSTFILILYSKHIIFNNYYKTHNVLSHLLPLILCVYNFHINICIITKDHKNSYNLWSMKQKKKKKKKKKVSTMHSIEMTSSWLFSRAK
jgi:hypothetical protein